MCKKSTKRIRRKVKQGVKMASVEDLDELLATRELNGVNDNLYRHGSDTNVGSIEKRNILDKEIEDLNDFADLLRPEKRYYTNIIKKVIEDKLKDREKIKKLKEENKKILNSKIGIDLSYDDYIPIQKVKAKIEELNDGIKRDMINYDKVQEESWKKAIHHSMHQKIETKKVLEELLEEK